LHPEIDKIVEGLVARKKYVYMCTNALLLKEKLHLFKPSKYLSFFRSTSTASASIMTFPSAVKVDTMLPGRY